MANTDDLHTRYMSDPYFKQLVDYLYVTIKEFKFTPQEMRDAAFYASLRYAQMNIEPLYLKTNEGQP